MLIILLEKITKSPALRIYYHVHTTLGKITFCGNKKHILLTGNKKHILLEKIEIFISFSL